MNVIIIPVDQNAFRRCLLPLLGQWLQAAGDSAARLVEIASRDWLGRNDLPIDDAEEQRRLHAETAPLIGVIRDASLCASDRLAPPIQGIP